MCFMYRMKPGYLITGYDSDYYLIKEPDLDHLFDSNYWPFETDIFSI